MNMDTAPVFDRPPGPLGVSCGPEGWRAWALGGATGRGVRVAVLDSGIDDTHPALEGSVARWARVVSGAEGAFSVEEAHHLDGAGHGTACAGIVRSLAPEAELWSVQVLGPDGRGSGDAFVAGLKWAIRQRADVCSMSLGTTSGKFFGALHDLADEAYYNGTILVVAASNRPVISYPALYPSVIGVAAIETEDLSALWFNRTPPVEFLAAGVNVRVPQPQGGWATVTGNSLAAPRVAGICAAIRSKHPQLDTLGMKAVLRQLGEARVKKSPAVGHP